MKFCSNCGNKFNETDKFCSNCGTTRISIIHSEHSITKVEDAIYTPSDLSEDEMGKYIDSVNLSEYYEGEVVEGKKHGKGIEYDEDLYTGSRFKAYEGDFLFNKREGFGIEFSVEGNLIYEGQWKSDKYHGLGITYFEGKKFYEGHLLKGMPHGAGKVFNPFSNELLFEGFFNHGNIFINGEQIDLTDEDYPSSLDGFTSEDFEQPDLNDDDNDPLGLRGNSNHTIDNDPLGIRENSNDKFEDVDLTQAEFIKRLKNQKADYTDIDF
jgi:hypothetical protein